MSSIPAGTRKKSRSTRGPLDKRPKNEHEHSHVDTCFELICEMAKERTVSLYREVLISSKNSIFFVCGLCPEAFSQAEFPRFRRHIVHHFEEDGASQAYSCIYSMTGCTFCAADEVELRRHHASHGSDSRPDVENVVMAVAPAEKLLIQFPGSDGRLIIPLSPISELKMD